MSIQPPGVAYLTFKQVFQSDKGRAVRLTVPDYQRAYSWEPRQRKDLLDDLEDLAEHERQGRLGKSAGHFCGTLVCTPEEAEPHYENYFLVDGQQRTSTLALLHCRLVHKVGGEPFIVSHGNDLVRPQKLDQTFFSDLLHGRNVAKPSTDAQKRYKEAANEIDKWINDRLHSHRYLNDIVRIIEYKLQFIMFILPDDREVSKVFESINNRGRPPTQMDLVKNHLIYMQNVHGWDGAVTSDWGEIQRLIAETPFRGNEDEDTVLRVVTTTMFTPGRRSAGETDFRIVADNICSADHGGAFREFLGFLKRSFQCFCDMRRSRNTSKYDKITTQLTYLNSHPQIIGVLPLIFLQYFRGHGGHDGDLLEAIEKANVRLYGLNAAPRSDSYNVQLNKLANEYFTNWMEESEHNLRNDIETYVRGIQKDGIKAIVQSLSLDDDEGGDFYKWDWLKYFLARWEESLLNKQGFDYGRLQERFHSARANDFLAAEHIYPRDCDDSLAYKDYQVIRRIGNLMLLPQGVNASLSNFELDRKVELIEEASNVNQLLVQNAHLRGYANKALFFRRYLEDRCDSVFGDSDRHWFTEPTRERNGLVAEAKTLCDLREESMIWFAIETFSLPGERTLKEHGESFLGMFSFCYEGEAYLSDREEPDNKTRENYVLVLSKNAIQQDTPLSRRVARLKRREEVLKQVE